MYRTNLEKTSLVSLEFFIINRNIGVNSKEDMNCFSNENQRNMEFIKIVYLKLSFVIIFKFKFY